MAKMVRRVLRVRLVLKAHLGQRDPQAHRESGARWVKLGREDHEAQLVQLVRAAQLELKVRRVPLDKLAHRDLLVSKDNKDSKE